MSVYNLQEKETLPNFYIAMNNEAIKRKDTACKHGDVASFSAPSAESNRVCQINQEKPCGEWPASCIDEC
jgi:hypothetical protein